MTRPSRPAASTFITADHGFLAATWFWPHDARIGATAVLVVPGVAHEERTMSGGLAMFGQALAERGLPALLIDLHGTAQSAGRLDDPTIGEHWRQDIRTAYDHLLHAGFSEVIVVGLRLGALLALDALKDRQGLCLAAWSPIASGRRHVRELRVLGQSGARDAANATELSIAGFTLPPHLLSHLSALEMSRFTVHPSSRVLLFDAEARLQADWLERLVEQGVVTERRAAVGTDAWLFSASDLPAPPLDDIRHLSDWCASRAAQSNDTFKIRLPKPHLEKSVAFEHAGVTIRETLVAVGPLGLTGVWCEPELPRPGAVRLLMSTTGPGRTFTDFARDQAILGHASLRFDFAGFGTSPERPGHQGIDLYSGQGRFDVSDAVEFLRREGHAAIIEVGFCAGAWAMFQAGPLPGVAAAVALNVALYRQPDAPPAVQQGAWALWSARLLKPIRRFAPWARFQRRLRTRLERATSARRRPVEWLDTMCRSGVAVQLAYADTDPGLSYLDGQIDESLTDQMSQGRLNLRVYAGLGHLAEGAAARQRMMDEVAEFCATVDQHVALGIARPSLAAAVTVPVITTAAANAPVIARHTANGRAVHL